ncbi:MAG TPA: hypothetical protein VIR54_02080 [Vicinamibacterales bacterium]
MRHSRSGVAVHGAAVASLLDALAARLEREGIALDHRLTGDR